jgi:hypothetical protein
MVANTFVLMLLSGCERYRFAIKAARFLTNSYFRFSVTSANTIMVLLIPFPLIRFCAFASMLIMIRTIVVNKEGTVDAMTINDCTGMLGTFASLLITLGTAQSPCGWAVTLQFFLVPLEVFFAVTFVLSYLSSCVL